VQCDLLVRHHLHSMQQEDVSRIGRES
jgi:hypothetical protein